VLSAGQDFKKDAEGKPIQVQVVNLLVTPQQAEELSLASAQTTIQLVLRNPLDHDLAKTPGTAVGLLFGGVRTKAPEDVAAAAASKPRTPRAAAPQPRMQSAPVMAIPPKKEAYVMEVISGNKKVETKFDGGGEGK
jgi:pilus assembly protein CpaB